jgi:hypothetical protein
MNIIQHGSLVDLQEYNNLLSYKYNSRLPKVHIHSNSLNWFLARIHIPNTITTFYNVQVSPLLKFGTQQVFDVGTIISQK